MKQERQQFKDQSFINLETFRKSGDGVRTPVWFVEKDEVFFVRTGADSGKVKRIHRNPNVMIAPCKADGTVTGKWVPASGKEIGDSATDKLVDQLLGKKYGFQKTLFAWMSRLRGDRYTVVQVELIDEKKTT